MGGFPKIMGTFLEVPRIRIRIDWGLYWGPPTLGNYHISLLPITVAACHRRAADGSAEPVRDARCFM